MALKINAGLLFVDRNDLVKFIPMNAECHAVLLKKPAVTVPGKPRVAGFFGNGIGNLFIDPHIQKRIHHSGLGYG